VANTVVGEDLLGDVRVASVPDLIVVAAYERLAYR
jgi:hypothetical protein